MSTERLNNQAQKRSSGMSLILFGIVSVVIAGLLFDVSIVKTLIEGDKGLWDSIVGVASFFYLPFSDYLTVVGLCLAPYGVELFANGTVRTEELNRAEKRAEEIAQRFNSLVEQLRILPTSASSENRKRAQSESGTDLIQQCELIGRLDGTLGYKVGFPYFLFAYGSIWLITLCGVVVKWNSATNYSDLLTFKNLIGGIVYFLILSHFVRDSCKRYFALVDRWDLPKRAVRLCRWRLGEDVFRVKEVKWRYLSSIIGIVKPFPLLLLSKSALISRDYGGCNRLFVSAVLFVLSGFLLFLVAPVLIVESFVFENVLFLIVIFLVYILSSLVSLYFPVIAFSVDQRVYAGFQWGLWSFGLVPVFAPVAFAYQKVDSFTFLFIYGVFWLSLLILINSVFHYSLSRYVRNFNSFVESLSGRLKDEFLQDVRGSEEVATTEVELSPEAKVFLKAVVRVELKHPRI